MHADADSAGSNIQATRLNAQIVKSEEGFFKAVVSWGVHLYTIVRIEMRVGWEDGNTG
jgi:hypothetical protein